jgi:hypothetical protein
MPLRSKTVIPAVAKRRAGIQKPLKCLDSRFRGNDETSSNIASFPAVGEFFSTLLNRGEEVGFGRALRSRRGRAS